METETQIVFCNILRRRRAPGAALPSELDGRLDVERTADAQNALVADMDIMVPVQLVAYPAVAHIRVDLMDLLDLFRDALVFLFIQALCLFKPLVIRRPCEMQKVAEFPHRKGLFLR